MSLLWQHVKEKALWVANSAKQVVNKARLNNGHHYLSRSKSDSTKTKENRTTAYYEPIIQVAVTVVFIAVAAMRRPKSHFTDQSYSLCAILPRGEGEVCSRFISDITVWVTVEAPSTSICSAVNQNLEVYLHFCIFYPLWLFSEEIREHASARENHPHVTPPRVTSPRGRWFSRAPALW